MKFIVKSLIGATALLGIYMAANLTSGYIKTRNYEPDFEAAWANAENLPSEVAFGHAPSPVLYAGVFAGMVLVSATLLIVYNRFAKKIHQQLNCIVRG